MPNVLNTQTHQGLVCVFTDDGISSSGADNIEEWGGSVREGVFALTRWCCH